MERIEVSKNKYFVFVDGVLMDKGMAQVIFYILAKSSEYSIPNTVTSIHKDASMDAIA